MKKNLVLQFVVGSAIISYRLTGLYRCIAITQSIAHASTNYIHTPVRSKPHNEYHLVSPHMNAHVTSMTLPRPDLEILVLFNC